MVEEVSSISLPMPILIYHFDSDGEKGENDGKGNVKEGEKELKCYSQWRKQDGVQEQDPPTTSKLYFGASS